MKRKAIAQRNPITLRAKTLKDGRQSLYLDFYIEGNRNHAHKYEFLKLYLLAGKSREIKELNAQTMMCANAILSQRIIERANGTADLKRRNDKILLSDYVRLFAEDKKRLGQSNERCSTINSISKHLSLFGSDIMMRHIDKDYCERFIKYLSTAKSFKDNSQISKSTASEYYKSFVAILNHAVKNDVIPSNPADKVSNDVKRLLTPEDSTKEYLTAEELQTLSQTRCGNENLKRAFLFACFCGLRLSDIITLQWEDITTEGETMFIKKLMVKTRRNVIVPLSERAKELLPPKQGTHVFTLPKHKNVESVLKTWAKRAGIKKHITFHVSRHTFATMLLTQGADLYTTSKLLGHTDISVTQVYAKIVDKKKEDAINLLNNIKF